MVHGYITHEASGTLYSAAVPTGRIHRGNEGELVLQLMGSSARSRIQKRVRGVKGQEYRKGEEMNKALPWRGLLPCSENPSSNRAT